MQVTIPYKEESFFLDIPEKNLIGVFAPNADTEICDGQSQILNALDNGGYGNFMSLSGSLTVIVNDGTRPTPTKAVLDVIGEDLKRAGARFIVATGSHRGPTADEYAFIFGKWYEIFRDSIIVHDCRDCDSLVSLGKTSFGTELLLNKEVARSGRVLVIGSVEPHYFAGYTGGRKAFLPGVSGFPTIEHNHSLAMSPDSCSLKLKGNPVHDDMEEAMEFLPMPVFSIQAVLDDKHRIAGVFAGGLDKSLNDAASRADEIFSVGVKEKADVVIAVAKYPMDIDLYQSQKAIENGKLALKDGGTLILVSSCRCGIGPDAFYRLLSAEKSPSAALNAIKKGYKLGYHKVAKLVDSFLRFKVYAVTDLQDEVLKKAFITPLKDLQALVDSLASEGKTFAVFTDASVTVPKVC